ncbi:MAG: hypothetical protein EXS09_12625 [Gemmataceae bacterium]|nr:hypothetical protein [Gemmataceae bacterium]
MSESMTLDVPADLARRARSLAAATNRRVKDVVVEWLGQVIAESPVEALSDAEVLGLSRSQLSDDEQAAISDLLGRQAELAKPERTRLDELLAIYRRGIVLKARATNEAVSRGLIPRLGDHAA